MARLLLNFRHVPDDEILDVRELLEDHGIAYYETRPSRWMISFGGIWLQDEAQAEEAMTLMADYQRRRKASADEEYEQLRREGRLETLPGRYRRNPLKFLLALLGIGAVLYFMAYPFLAL
ncbi:MAG: DUF6164 family protein [Oleiphilaceae bacterium]|nr:DUF6164 family protein [Oleiphilaceae bacterium]